MPFPWEQPIEIEFFFLKIAIKISRNTIYCNITTTILTEFQLTAPLKNTLQKTNVNLLEIRYFLVRNPVANRRR